MYIALLHKALVAWRQDHVPRLAAALSYYTLFSLAPLFLIIISLTGFFLGEYQVKSYILSQVSNLLGPGGTDVIYDLIQQKPSFSHNVILSLVGLMIIFFGATGVFGQLKVSLDHIWEVPVRKERSFWTLIEHNFLPFTMVLGTGFLLLVSLILTTFMNMASRYVISFLPSPLYLLEGLNSVVAFAVITFLFAFIYRILPDVSIKWSDVWSGAVVAACLFTIGKLAIGFYIGNSNILSAYGAAGSILVILVWVYYSAQILFFGAEFTKVYTRTYGSQKMKDEPKSTRQILGMYIEDIIKLAKSQKKKIA